MFQELFFWHITTKLSLNVIHNTKGFTTLPKKYIKILAQKALTKGQLLSISINFHEDLFANFIPPKNTVTNIRYKKSAKTSFIQKQLHIKCWWNRLLPSHYFDLFSCPARSTINKPLNDTTNTFQIYFLNEKYYLSIWTIASYQLQKYRHAYLLP